MGGQGWRGAVFPGAAAREGFAYVLVGVRICDEFVGDQPILVMFRQADASERRLWHALRAGLRSRLRFRTPLGRPGSP